MGLSRRRDGIWCGFVRSTLLLAASTAVVIVVLILPIGVAGRVLPLRGKEFLKPSQILCALHLLDRNLSTPKTSTPGLGSLDSVCSVTQVHGACAQGSSVVECSSHKLLVVLLQWRPEAAMGWCFNMLICKWCQLTGVCVGCKPFFSMVLLRSLAAPGCRFLQGTHRSPANLRVEQVCGGMHKG